MITYLTIYAAVGLLTILLLYRVNTNVDEVTVRDLVGITFVWIFWIIMIPLGFYNFYKDKVIWKRK